MRKMPRRWVTLTNIIKKFDHKIGAEIGCFKGKTTKFLLNKLDIELLHCIDPWIHYPDFEKVIYNKKTKEMDFEKDGYQIFLNATEKFKDRINILKMFSSEAASQIEDNSLDFIFIDGNHSYKYVKEDILLWIPKIKVGGLISGHDYGDNKFGVTEAVDELIGKGNFKVDNKIWYLKK